jgi:hypothetical protein
VDKRSLKFWDVPSENFWVGKDDICRCPEEHRLVLDGTCWRCLGRAVEATRATQPLGAFGHLSGV